MYEEANAKMDTIEATGKIVEVLPNAMFKVELENGHVVDCHISGKLRQNYIKFFPEEIVIVEISPYDLTRGRIISKEK